MLELGQAMLNLMLLADPIKQQLKRPFTPLLIGKLNAIIGQDRWIRYGTCAIRCLRKSTAMGRVARSWIST